MKSSKMAVAPRAWLLALCTAMGLLLSTAFAQNSPGGAETAVTSPAASAVQPNVRPVAWTPGIDVVSTVRRRGVLRVGVLMSEPMAIRNERGELEGFSVDVAKRMAEEMGVGIEFIVTSPLFMMQELLDGRFDLIATGLWITTERAMMINFSDPTVVEGVYLVASKAKAGKKLLLADYDQPDVKIAVFSNTVQEKLARRLFPRATVVRVDGNELRLVRSGDAHAALVPTLSPQVLVGTAPDELFLPRETALSQTPAALGVRKGDPDFLNFLNTWLSLRRGEGWLDERANYWAARTSQK
jgi:polar amino acid transport system substrate-binding protein